MKKTLSFLIFLLAINIWAQSPQDYFPDTGSSWYYEITPLDSLNNPIQQLSFIEADSFAISGEYHGRESNVFLSKELMGDNFHLPWSDSSFFSADENIISQYFGSGMIDDTSFIPDSSLLGVAASLNGWYDAYRFNAAIGDTYTLVRKDTSINIDGREVDIRIEVKGKRLEDELVNTELGEFTAAKFRMTFGIYYMLQVPLLPPFPFPLFYINTDVWIAENNWIVKERTPSTRVNLSMIGGPSFYIPGSEKVIVNDPKLLSLAYPFGGETWFSGDTEQVVWRSFNAGEISLYYSPDSGESWELIAGNVPSEVSFYNWTIPAVNADSVILKAVSEEDTSVVSISGVFSLRLKPEIDLVYPDGGEEFDSGQEVEIRWTAENSRGLNIYASCDEGNTWEFISEIESGDTAFSWEAPDIIHAWGKIKIEEKDFPRFFDQSDSLFLIMGGLDAEENEETLPEDFVIYGNYPNPFNPETIIRFGLPEPTFVRIRIFDILGNEIAKPFEAHMDAGDHETRFDGSDLPSGIYIYSLITPQKTITRKMMLVK